MAKEKGPLTQDDLKTLNRVIARCNQIADLCNKAGACHIDMDKLATDNKERLEIASKLKATFFPKEP